ncbi:4-hydroxybenzoate polyprenyltransferase [Catenulispora sp. GAS73]|uniref:UbiA family prenyltransferase n=1 Tax=Catenulispora sp. GAS73 TaxID=3156269 RepID=UPI0035141C75
MDVRPLAACWSEARPVVQAVFVMRFLAGALLVDPGHLAHPGRIALAAAGWSCSTIAIYVFNGIADRREDIANGSTRPIASGRLSVRYASRVVAVLACAALGCAWSFGFTEGLCATLFLLVGYGYSGPPFPLKNTYISCTLGGIALGLITYLGGCAAVGHGISAPFAIFAVSMSLWMGGVGGIAKDLSDVEGDRIAGRRTLPIVVGERSARRLLAAVAAVVALSFGGAARISSAPLVWSAGVVLIGAVVVGRLSFVSPTSRDRRRMRSPYRAFMWTQHVTHIVLAATIWGLPH